MSDSTQARLGQTLQGRYRIESLLGSGGLGVVYRAMHLSLGRPVAIKVLHQEHDANVDHQKRFERELAMLSQLSHPHIVTVTDSGLLPNGAGFLVMELLEGETLETLLSRGPMPPARAAAVCRQILLGLSEAHRKGILHRDIKPANVVLTPLADGHLHAKLLDFGLAKGRREMGADANAIETLTTDGVVVGTPTYMAPETGLGKSDARSDLYSVGVVFFHMLVGRPPFMDDDKIRVIRMHIENDLPELADLAPSLRPSAALADFVRRALAKVPSDRFASAAEMLAALDALPQPIAESVGTPRPAPISGTESTISLQSSDIVSVEVPPSSPSPSTPPQVPAMPRATRSGAAPLLIVGATAAMVAVAGAFALWLDADEPAEDAPAPREVEEAPPPSPPPSTEDDEVAREVEGDPTNPFEGATPLPEELRSARRKILRGRTLGDDEVRDLARYQQRHREDPRPSLLLARHHRLARQWRACVRHYAAAYRIDPSIARFSPMLPDRARAAREAEAAGAPAELLVRAYGRAAVAEVDRALARRPPASERTRLTRLRRRLAAAPQ